MTHSKTRLRVARIAAAAVFAAGASLTAVGTASALDLSVGIMGGGGDNGGTSEGTEGGSEGTEGSSGETGGVVEGVVEGSIQGGDQGGSEGGDQGGSEGGDQGGDQGGSEGGDQGGDQGGSEGSIQGGDQGGSEGGNQGGSAGPATTGGTGGPEDPQTCVLDESTVDCGNNTDTDAAGTRPISQAKPKEELAATGAAETTLLLVGAATMIAGGVGFRLMPRLTGRRTVA